MRGLELTKEWVCSISPNLHPISVQQALHEYLLLFIVFLFYLFCLFERFTLSWATATWISLQSSLGPISPQPPLSQPNPTQLDSAGKANLMWNCFGEKWCGFKTLPKAQRTRGLSSAYQSNFFRSYHKFLHKSSKSRPSTNFKISTKHQHLNKTYKSWPNLASESRPRLNFITKTKHQ